MRVLGLHLDHAVRTGGREIAGLDGLGNRRGDRGGRTSDRVGRERGERAEGGRWEGAAWKTVHDRARYHGGLTVGQPDAGQPEAGQAYIDLDDQNLDASSRHQPRRVQLGS